MNGYECAVQHVPSQILTYAGEIIAGAGYYGNINLEYPLVFPSRTIQNITDFLDNLGPNGGGNIMYSGDGLISNVYIGKLASGALNGVRVIQYGVGSKLQAFDLMIWAKFEG